jgi:pentatricopeptide repeat protein
MILNTLISLAFNHKIFVDASMVLQQMMRFRNTTRLT